MSDVQAVLFDFSGTLFRLEEDESWFAGMELDEGAGDQEVDGHVQAELMRRLTAPTGRSVHMTPEALEAWTNRDLGHRTCTARPICTCCANRDWPGVTQKRCTAG